MYELSKLTLKDCEPFTVTLMYGLFSPAFFYPLPLFSYLMLKYCHLAKPLALLPGSSLGRHWHERVYRSMASFSRQVRKRACVDISTLVY